MKEKIKEIRKNAEQSYIIKVLNLRNWRIVDAARSMGINHSTLFRKMKRYGIHKTILKSTPRINSGLKNKALKKEAL